MQSNQFIPTGNHKLVQNLVKFIRVLTIFSKNRLDFSNLLNNQPNLERVEISLMISGNGNFTLSSISIAI